LKGGARFVVVMPAYNAAGTLEATYPGLARNVVDEVILVDDVSDDATVDIAERLGLKVVVHIQNRGSRLSSGTALSGGMPLWKYLSNRFLTLVENLAFGLRLSEYHTGLRAYSRRLLETAPSF
jgi:hypothetical protein